MWHLVHTMPVLPVSESLFQPGKGGFGIRGCQGRYLASWAELRSGTRSLRRTEAGSMERPPVRPARPPRSRAASERLDLGQASSWDTTGGRTPRAGLQFTYLFTRHYLPTLPHRFVRGPGSVDRGSLCQTAHGKNGRARKGKENSAFPSVCAASLISFPPPSLLESLWGTRVTTRFHWFGSCWADYQPLPPTNAGGSGQPRLVH